MNPFRQRTLEHETVCSGTGLHSGARVTLRLRPAPVNTGIRFVRVDLPGAPVIPALAKHVVDTRLATTIGIGEARVATIEHLCSALVGLGIDNVRAEIDGPELPIVDGSAAPFSLLLREAGIHVQREPKRFMVVRREVVARSGDASIAIGPSPQFKVTSTIDFNHPLISDQRCSFVFSDAAYHREIAKARTFCFSREVEALKAVGLAKGGSLANAIVVDDFSIMNPEGLRFPDEFVRHKVLDTIGDLALLGMPVIGHVKAHKSGHTLNHGLVMKVLSEPGCFEEISATPREVERLALAIPQLEPNLVPEPV